MIKWIALLALMIGGIVNLSASIEMDIKKGLCRIDGVEYPMIGFGTYHPQSGGMRAEDIELAIQTGYRMLDTATFYKNFDGIARALKNKGRSQIYLISKVWHDKQSPEDLRKDLNATLARLQIDYLDAYLLHWPNSKISIEKTLAAMNELRLAKKIRHIGLSNVTVNHLKRALEVAVPISWVQVEMHPYFCDFELIKFCREHSIGVQAWSPLGRGRISQDALLARIGKKYGKSSSQVAMKWIVQHGCIPLPSSKNEKHLFENLNVNDFTLTDDEMSEIDKRAKVGQRERLTKEMIGFDDEFDLSYGECWPKR